MLRRLRAEERGHSLLETALSLSLLLSVMISIIGFSEAAYARHFVAAAARQGTRYAMVRGSTFAGTSCSTALYNCQASATDIKKYILAHVPLGIAASAVTVTSTWPGVAAFGLNCLTLNGTNSPGCDIQVTVSYGFRYSLPYLPKGLITLQSTSTLVIAQ